MKEYKGIVPVCSGDKKPLYSVPYLIPFALDSTRGTATSSSKRTSLTKKREINPGFERIKGNDRHSNRTLSVIFFPVFVLRTLRPLNQLVDDVQRNLQPISNEQFRSFYYEKISSSRQAYLSPNIVYYLSQVPYLIIWK